MSVVQFQQETLVVFYTHLSLSPCILSAASLPTIQQSQKCQKKIIFKKINNRRKCMELYVLEFIIIILLTPLEVF